MRTKNLEKDKAIRLRRKGFSLSEIASRLNISKSSASLWLRDVRLSNEAQRRITQKRIEAYEKSAHTHRTQTEQRLKEAISSAEKTRTNFRLDRANAMVLCALLYWCEGEKTKNDQALAFTNSDPKLVALFLSLFRRSFKINERQFRACLHLHDYHRQEDQVRFWSHLTRIPRSQFLKIYRKPHTGKRRREGYAGCASVRYYDTRVARELQAVARAILKQYGGL